MKPSEYQQRLRIFRARAMLDFSRCSVEAIAAAWIMTMWEAFDGHCAGECASCHLIPTAI